MKKIALSILLCFIALCGAEAQSQVKYGYLSYNTLLRAMPEYAEAQLAVGELRKKYEAEASYNEMNFKRLFAEFLEGQKEFPENILLKRQRDLQEAMEKDSPSAKAPTACSALLPKNCCSPYTYALTAPSAPWPWSADMNVW